MLFNSALNPYEVDPEFYWSIFWFSPFPTVIISPDPENFTVVDANIAYLDLIDSSLAQVAGKTIFAAENFWNCHGKSALFASCIRVLESKKCDIMEIQRYNLPTKSPASSLSVSFQEKYWRPVNSPVFRSDGSVQALIYGLMDVSDSICSRRNETLCHPGDVTSSSIIGMKCSEGGQIEASFAHQKSGGDRRMEGGNQTLKSSNLQLQVSNQGLASFMRVFRDLIKITDSSRAPSLQSRFICFQRELRESNKALTDSYLELQVSNQGLTSSNKSFRESNQILTDSYLELQVSNQGLTSSNESLRESNQTLTDSNLGLQVSNQG